MRLGQIEMKNQRKEKEKQERLARERREEQAAAEYNPWGRGGAGAPLRNEGGQIVADYRSMRNHKSPTHPPKPPPFAHDQPPAFQLGRGRGQQPTVSQAMAHASHQRQGAPGHAGGGGGGGGGQGEVRHTRFQFSALSPEKQTEVMQKQAAREALQQQLREQIEEKQRRKAAEKEAEREWDRYAQRRSHHSALPCHVTYTLHLGCGALCLAGRRLPASHVSVPSLPTTCRRRKTNRRTRSVATPAQHVVCVP